MKKKHPARTVLISGGGVALCCAMLWLPAACSGGAGTEQPSDGGGEGGDTGSGGTMTDGGTTGDGGSGDSTGSGGDGPAGTGGSASLPRVTIELPFHLEIQSHYYSVVAMPDGDFVVAGVATTKEATPRAGPVIVRIDGEGEYVWHTFLREPREEWTSGRDGVEFRGIEANTSGQICAVTLDLFACLDGGGDMLWSRESGVVAYGLDESGHVIIHTWEDREVNGMLMRQLYVLTKHDEEGEAEWEILLDESTSEIVIDADRNFFTRTTRDNAPVSSEVLGARVSKRDALGAPIWTVDVAGGRFFDSAVAPSGSSLFMVDDEETLHALDAESGESRWVFSAPDLWRLHASPSSNGIYVETQSTPDGRFLLHVDDEGNLDWQSTRLDQGWSAGNGAIGADETQVFFASGNHILDFSVENRSVTRVFVYE